MDVADNDSFPMGSPLPEEEAVSPQSQEEEHPSELNAASERFDPLSTMQGESDRRLDYTAEVREAKIRELQDEIKQGSYHIAAEQIADRMLRNTLGDQRLKFLPGRRVCPMKTELFEIKPVADGVYAAVAAPAYKVNSNAAIIVNEDGVVVVDSHSKPSAARVLVEQIKGITSKPVRHVINTHFHWDHWQGNEVYPGTYGNVEVITTEITREALQGKGLKRIQDQLRTLPNEIKTLQTEIARVTNAERKAQLTSDLHQAEAYLIEIKGLKPTLPTLTFESSMRLLKTEREIQLLHLGRAHTEGDLFVYLPKERLVITGDAVIEWTPFMGDGYPLDWVHTLKRLEQLDFTHMIMGHGDVAGKEWLRMFYSYIADLIEAVKRHAAVGMSLDEMKRLVPEEVAPRYEEPLSRYPDYRPWRTQVLANIERVYAAVS
jgi:cyclase